MAVVQPNGVVLYARLGAGYYPIACSKDVSISTDSGELETAPKTNGVWRTYEYDRLGGTITGSGLVQVVSDAGKYNIINLWDYQFSQLPVLVKFQIEDVDGNISVYECSCIVRNVTISGSSTGSGSSFSYELLINGAVSNSSTPTSGSTTVDAWDYEESVGGTTTIGSSVLIGADVLAVYRNTDVMKDIITGTPDVLENEVLFDSTTGQLTWAYPLEIGEYVKVIYVS